MHIVNVTAEITWDAHHKCYTAVVANLAYADKGVGSGETHEEAFGSALYDFVSQNDIVLED